MVERELYNMDEVSSFGQVVRFFSVVEWGGHARLTVQHPSEES